MLPKVVFVVRKFALLDRGWAVLTELDQLGQAADLGWDIGNIESSLALERLLEYLVEGLSHNLLEF